MIGEELQRYFLEVAITYLRAYAKQSERGSAFAIPGEFDNCIENVLSLYKEHYGEEFDGNN